MPHGGQIILVIEDEESIRRFLRASMSGHGYLVREAECGERGLAVAAQERPDLIILDLGLPDMDGCRVLEGLRAWTQAPVIVLSARGREGDKIAAFEVGADDYLTKPFGMRELLARIRAVMRRTGQNDTAVAQQQQYQCGDLVIDLLSHRVNVGAREIRLTPTEFKLLSLMGKYAGKVLTHRFLLQEVWGSDRIDEVNYLRVFMAALRRKIEANSAQPRYVLTEQGVGYRLADE